MTATSTGASAECHQSRERDRLERGEFDVDGRGSAHGPTAPRRRARRRRSDVRRSGSARSPCLRGSGTCADPEARRRSRATRSCGHTEPLPLVPVTCTIRYAVVGTTERVEHPAGRFEREALDVARADADRARSRGRRVAGGSRVRPRRAGPLRGTGRSSVADQDAARRGRVVRATSVRVAPGSERPSRARRRRRPRTDRCRRGSGRSYMTPSSTSSRMARSPRAPVPRASAWSATARVPRR